jgi:uncharacterized NAD(P)/FAD-binding protein YdhS
VHESCEVTDLQATAEGVRLWAQGEPLAERFDLAVIATGHVWPAEEESTRTFFPSPWSGLMDAQIPACRVGIMGTSLSGIDAAMAVVMQHGEFVESAERPLQFRLNPASEALNIVLMSRAGILPEADFYCPIPYEPLAVVTPDALDKAIAAGSKGLLDRVFRLMAQEIARADPQWSARIALPTLDADSFSDAWLLNGANTTRFTGRRPTLWKSNATSARNTPWHGAMSSSGCMRPCRRLSRIWMRGIVSAFAPGSRGCSSIITPLFRRNRSAACWRCAKPGSSALSPSARITR